MQERDNYKHQIEELKSRCEDRKYKVDEERQKFMEFKKQVAQNSLNSRSGRPIAPKVITAFSQQQVWLPHSTQGKAKLR